jgi:hypothetical protein
MFATLRRHQKWVFAGIIAVVIPSFVVFFTPDASLPGGGGKGNFGAVNGRSITQEEFARAYHEAEMRYLFSYGTWPGGREDANRSGFDLDRETRNRVLLLNLIQENKIHVSDEAAASWIANAFRDRREKVFRLDSYNQFVKKTLTEKGIHESDFERFASHEVAIQQLVSVYGLNGRLVTPQESERLFRHEHDEFQTEAVVFSATNYLSSVAINPTALSQFYSNRLAAYRIPERVQVNYIKFDFTNFLAEADQQLAKQTNLTQIINGMYQQQGENYFTGPDGKPLPEAEAKIKIKEQLRHEFSLQAARKKAGVFAVELFKLTPQKEQNLSLLASNQYTVVTTEPFSEFEGPKGLLVMENFTRAAFNLTPEEPFAPPINGEDGVFIVALHKKLAAEFPAFDTIKNKVTEDYRHFQALSIARQQGQKFYESATNSLAQGKSFADLCKEARVTPIALPNFSLSTRSLTTLDERLDLSSIKDQAFRLQPGKIGAFMISRDGGFALHLRGIEPVSDAVVKAELPEFIKSMRQTRMYEAFGSWLNQQIAEARISAPPTAKTAEAAN